MALLDRLQKGLYFVPLALHLELNTAVDQVLDQASDFVALCNFLDAKSKAHPLNPAFVKDALRNHRSFEFRVLQGRTSTNTLDGSTKRSPNKGQPSRWLQPPCPVASYNFPVSGGA